MNIYQELQETVNVMVAEGRGILAIDESFPTIKKRFHGITLESNEENRRAWRELLITTAGSQQYISGMILFDETIRQSAKDGTPFPESLLKRNIMPGIKVDTGAKDMAGHPGEKITEGLDGLRERLAEYKSLGAKFAKWRAVITIGNGIPSEACIQSNTHALARYAALCQEIGIVPIVEPEVLMDGKHTIEQCNITTTTTLNALFNALRQQGISLQHTILKVNMVISGKQCTTQANVETVSRQTVQCLLNTAPASIAGIVFLSGGQTAELATIHLNAMNSSYSKLPWPLSFSYGRALQEPCLKAWAGNANNTIEAQGILLHREKCNSLATLGQYTTDSEVV